MGANQVVRGARLYSSRPARPPCLSVSKIGLSLSLSHFHPEQTPEQVCSGFRWSRCREAMKKSKYTEEQIVRILQEAESG